MKKIFNLLTISLGLFPFLALNYFSILMIIWFLVAIAVFFKTQAYKTAKLNKKKIFVFFGITFLFWAYFLYFPFCNDYNEMAKILKKTLPFLVFPIGFFLGGTVLSKQSLKYILNVFVGSVLLINFLGWFRVFNNGFLEVIEKNDFYHPLIRNIFIEATAIHIPYLGLFTSFAALIIVYNLVLKQTNKQSQILSILSILSILFLLVSIYFYSARMALGIFIVGFIFIVFKKIKSLKVKLAFLILIPVISICVLLLSPIKERYTQSLETEWVLPHAEQQPHEVNYRYAILHCSSEVLKEHFWFGVGPDQVQKYLNDCYMNFTYKSYEDFSQVNYNSHNQYIDFYLKFGIIIGSFLILSVFIFIRKANLIYQVFLISIFFSFLTENILDRQMGVVFYSLFNTIFVLYNKNYFEKNISS